MQQHLRPRFEVPDHRVRVQVAQQQHHLEKQHAGGPHRGAAAEPGQDDLGYHRLHLEQQEGAHHNRQGVEEHGYLYAATPVTFSPITRACIWSVPSYVLTDSRLHMWRMIGYSSVIPLAPSRSRLSRAQSSAMATLFRFSMEMCAGSSFPRSFRRPACTRSNCALVISVIILASFSWRSWCEAMGRSSNCLRRMEYCRAVS